MYFLYSFLLTLGFLLLLPRFIYDWLRHGKYAAGFRERLGGIKPLSGGGENEFGKQVVWLHCVSVGETQAARPVVDALLQRYPHCTLVVSTTTLTGQRLAHEMFGIRARRVFYFPFDWKWTVRRALRRINPSIVLVMETELWFRFLRECRKRGVAVALVNGRLSPKSMRGYRLIRSLMRRVVNNLTLALMQTDNDAKRIIELGLAPSRVHVSGNVKFDLQDQSTDKRIADELQQRFHFTNQRPLVVFASTHKGEDQILLQAWSKVIKSLFPLRPRVLIAPRHPERFAEVSKLLDASGLAWTRRSASPGVNDKECDAILLDSIGELRATFQLAQIVFVGGSLIPHGGHNVLEPAHAGCAIITGAHTANFAGIIKTFLDAEALIQLPEMEEEVAVQRIAAQLDSLLRDEKTREQLGARARAVLETNRGATNRTIELLAELFEPKNEKHAPHVYNLHNLKTAAAASLHSPSPQPDFSASDERTE